jgi:late competence protein required for DNA uptake (superfamily II DNA/RNA helicase)
MKRNAASIRKSAVNTLQYVLDNGSINSADRIYIEGVIKELQSVQPLKLICRQCGKPFERLRNQLMPGQTTDHVFCCKSCSSLYRVRKGKTMYDFVCEFCGKSFTLPYRKYGEHIFCTRECHYDFLRNKGPRT